MTPEHWPRVEALFEAALALPPPARAAFLASATEDPALREEVASLLRATEPGPVDRLADALAAPVAAARAAADAPGPDGGANGGAPSGPAAGRTADARIGALIGPYRVVRLLGRGGMGAVYLAERADGQFEQRVALKLVREGADALHARFVHERSALARLEHPGIARLLDGGLAGGDGPAQPYFAMEYVEGERLDRYCDARALGVEPRLRLLGQVCEAVQHAHQQLIVHRDLKPSNVLVTENGAPHVKLLDFGIAKLLEGGPDVPLTRTATRLLTPEYAAPEQVRGEAISTATDVYSLGVMLYELLTGRRPYAVAELAPAALERTICETVPPRPSTVVRRTAAEDPASRARGTEPATLARRLQGDLDTIVLKALEKEPARRYPSAQALLDDIERHLAGLPVRARPATWRYRARTFVRRHRAPVAAAALALLALVGGIVGVAWQAQRAAAERDRARAEAAKAEEALDFLVTVFEASDPNVARADTVTARTLLDRGARRLSAIEEPAVRATLAGSLGRVYQSLGQYEEAGALLSEALALRRALPAQPPHHLAASLLHLGALRAVMGAHAEADSLLRRARDVLAPAAAAHPALAARIDHHLGHLLSERGMDEDAEPLLRRALAARRALHAAGHPDVQATQRSLFLLLHRRGDFAAAEALYREAVAHGRATPGRINDATVEHYLGLARLLSRFRRDYAGAEAALREVLPAAAEHYGERHPLVATTRGELALALAGQGRLEDAEAEARAALRTMAAQFGEAHRETAIAQSRLADLLSQRGAHAEAVALQRTAAATNRALFGADHLSALTAQVRLADLARRAGDPAALELYTAAVARSSAALGPDHPHVAYALQGQGWLQLEAGLHDGAAASFEQALATRRRAGGPGHWRVAEAECLLARAHLAANRREDAEGLLGRCVPALEAALGAASPVTQRAREVQAQLGGEAVGQTEP